jgi:hypothetical protein
MGARSLDDQIDRRRRVVDVAPVRRGDDTADLDAHERGTTGGVDRTGAAADGGDRGERQEDP